MYAKIYKNFVEESDRLSLLKDIEERASKFSKNNAGANRQFLRLDGTDMYQDIHKKYFDKIVNHLGIKSPEIDPLLGILYSVIHPTGFIHNHIDHQWMYDSGNFVNYRFNLLLQRGAGDGYDPIIQNTKHYVEAGDAWSFPASLYLHGTEPVSGPEIRIVMQYGFTLHKNEYKKLSTEDSEIILTEKMKEYYAKNSRNGIARSGQNFFSQQSQDIP